MLHKVGLRTLGTPTPMRPRLAGTRSMNRWYSSYHALKVSIAFFNVFFEGTHSLLKEVA